MLAKLVAYKAEHGDCNVSKDYKKDPSLGSWVSIQRRKKKTCTIDPTREERLNLIGFVWERLATPIRTDWESMFDRLVKYKAKHGNCNVPKKYQGNTVLGTWVRYQRNYRRKGTIQRNREKRLDDIGFSWRVGANASRERWNQLWNTMFRQLVDYKAKHGDCNVPTNGKSKKCRSLGMWVCQQRCKQRKGALDGTLKKRLDGIGFTWELCSASKPALKTGVSRMTRSSSRRST